MRWLLRIALTMAMAVFTVSLFVAGLLAAALFTVWSLLHGRWPRLNLGLSMPLRHMHRRQASMQRQSDFMRDATIEGQARELS